MTESAVGTFNDYIKAMIALWLGVYTFLAVKSI
jgi:hypothetical protein